MINSNTGRTNAGRVPKRAHPAQLLESIQDTADRLRISRSSVYDLLRTNQLEAVKIGKSRRIVIASALQLVERLRSGTAA